MEIDLKQLGAWLTENGMMNRTFFNFSKDEILDFCEQVHDATQVQEYTPPYINEKNELVIPLYTHPKHRYWTDRGQGLSETLKEMGVSDEFYQRYCPAQDNEGLPRHRPSHGDEY